MITKKILGAYLQQIFIAFKGFIILPILIKNIPLEVYGAYVLILSLSSLITGISSFGISFKMTRFLPSSLTRLEKSENIFIPLILNLAFLIIILIFSYIFWNNITNQLFKSYIPFLLFAILLVVMVLYKYGINYFRYTNREIYFTNSEIFRNTIELIVLIFSIYILKLTINQNTLIQFVIISYAPIVIISYIKLISELGLPKIKISIIKSWKELKLGFPLTINALIDIIIASSDRYLIAILASTVLVGIYNPAYLLGTIFMIVPKALSITYPQQIITLWDSNRKVEARELVKKQLFWIYSIWMPFIITLIFFGTEILKMLTNDEIASQGSAVSVVIGIASLFYSRNYIINSFLAAQLKTKMILKINVLIALFNIVFNLIILHFYQNLTLVALTTLLSYFISNVILSLKTQILFTEKSLKFNLLIKLSLNILVIGSVYLIKLNTTLSVIIIALITLTTLYKDFRNEKILVRNRPS